MAPTLAGVLVLAALLGGCSYRLGTLFGNTEKPEHTGSIGTPTRPGAGDRPSDADLAYARAAARDVLGRGGTQSQAWENPGSGARGTVTPLADPRLYEGVLCRDFLASYVRDGRESWLQGEACRRQRGEWEVRSLGPGKRN